MAFADPQTVTINAVPITLARVSFGTSGGAFGASDGLTKLSIANTNGSRVRRMIRLDNSKIAADPLLAGVNVKAGMSVYLVADVPLTGYTVAEQKFVVDGFTAYLTASSGAKVTQFLAGEI